MRNFIQDGRVLTVNAPYDVTSGKGILVGALFGVAACSVADGAEAEIVTEGVFDLDKVPAQSWTIGQAVYWDDTAKVCTSVATGNTRIGVAIGDASNGSHYGCVRLNGSF